MTTPESKPISCPHCQQPITPADAASALANTAPKGKGSRPGAAKLVRNPYGRAGKPKEDEILSPAEEDIREEVRNDR